MCTEPDHRVYSFFNRELGWAQQKVDDLLVPIIQKMNKRSQSGSANKQGNLSSFFDIPTGGGAPRKRQAYSSRRLQQVVADYRAKRASGSGGALSGEDSEHDDDDVRPKPKKRRKTSGVSDRGSARGRRGRGTGSRGRGKGRKVSAEAEAQLSSDEKDTSSKQVTNLPSAPPKPKPKPRPIRKKAEVRPNDQNGDEDEWLPGT